MATVTICSDFGAPKNKVWHCFYCFPIYFPKESLLDYFSTTDFTKSFKKMNNHCASLYKSHYGSFCLISSCGHIEGRNYSSHPSLRLPMTCHAPLVVSAVKSPSATQETRVWSLDWEDPLEKGTATHSSTLAWKIPQTEEPCGPQSMGLQRVGHNWATNTFTFFHFTAMTVDTWEILLNEWMNTDNFDNSDSFDLENF